jgi:hypothetical protein
MNHMEVTFGSFQHGDSLSPLMEVGWPLTGLSDVGVGGGIRRQQTA